MKTSGRKPGRWRPAGLAAVAGGVLLLAACGGGPAGKAASSTISPANGRQLAGIPGATGSPPPSLSPAASAAPSPAPPPAAAPAAANALTIHNFAFTPAAVSVKAGTTIRWTNRDTEAHTVTSDTGVFGSPVLQPGASYSYTFTKPGTYSYHCNIHPFMTGKVVVS